MPDESRPDFSLLEMVTEVVQGKRGGNINELISLLALSNTLGIITYLNSQELKPEKKSGSSDIKELASTLLGMLGSSSDKKINPAALLNLVKNLSGGETQSQESKDVKSGEKEKNI
ncbi:MAG: hypothetical protein L5655_03760 [Thermosediminibacteraceae bacterium]|nr:hypothetical protein [Thermosediminibacteraceae bacterium]